MARSSPDDAVLLEQTKLELMTELSQLIDRSNPRVSILLDSAIPDDRQCVLWWISRAKRLGSNHAANEAIALANHLKLPVIAVFCLAPAFPRATLRAYHFMAEGLIDLGASLAQNGIGWLLEVGDPSEIVPRLASDHRAAAIVTDLDPLRTGREWRTAVADALAVPLIEVDADTVVPSSLFAKEEWAPRTIRPKIYRVLDGFLQPIERIDVHVRSNVVDAPDPLSLISDLELDREVGPSSRCTGGSGEAERRLDRFVSERLGTYATDRNRSDIEGTSDLSPYLHFGQIGPTQVAVAAAASDAPQESVDAFMNELVVQRELCINFALRNPDYDTFAGIPDWGQKTLAKHAGDPREAVYDLEVLETGNTNDPLWNAAQRQMVGEGWMPNRLRMYWAKRVLAWTRSPTEAFEIVTNLNDRYFVDGRDANGYAGIAWSIGGRHDRPFPPERPILGLIRPMGARGMAKHFDMARYIAQVRDRFG
ncbi:deoxyribodipyrimidine photo-lyase [soil metagenome]